MKSETPRKANRISIRRVAPVKFAVPLTFKK
jgi:hypothetical protein